MMDILDRKTLEAHDNLLARQLVTMAWCYHDMLQQLKGDSWWRVPDSFFALGSELVIVADLMWQEHSDWAYEQRLADINQVYKARLN